MKINFKDEVLKRKEALIKDLKGLIQINSELTTFDPNRKGAPFGEGTKEALDYMLRLGANDGFVTENLEGYAGHIVYGDQKPFVGMIGHLDVVPAGNGWSHAPYGGDIVDNKMYGRGTEDDKGPTIAAYYALKILKELNVPLSKRVKLILGNDEETDWRCMRHYFSKYPEQPVSGFIPDADFPLIYAEKGIFRMHVKGVCEPSDIISVHGGFRDNMVPDYATATIRKHADFDHVLLYQNFLAEHHYQGDIMSFEDHYEVKMHGVSAHGSTPEMGENAIVRLFEYFKYIGFKHELLSLVEDKFFDDVHGQKLGVDYHDAEMGPLTINLGVLDFANDAYEIKLNVRYPNGVDYDTLVESINQSVKSYGAKGEVSRHQKLLYQDPNSHLVKTLLDVYRKHTNDHEGQAFTIGGGTFARAMSNSVAFGPHFSGTPTYIHQKDEHIDLDQLIKATIIYTEALYELAK
ncbi:MAG: dipeptidase PepV [Acholeplasmataceae bacterium]